MLAEIARTIELIFKGIINILGSIIKPLATGLGIVLVLIFLPSLLMIILGFHWELRWLIAIGALWRSFFMLLLRSSSAPLIIPISGVDRYLYWIKSAYIFELIIALLLVTLMGPIKNNPDAWPILLISALLMSAVGSSLLTPRTIAPIASVCFLLALLSLFFPNLIEKYYKSFQKIEESFAYTKLINPSLEDIESGEFIFFNPKTGDPEYWYSIVDGEIRMFDRPGFDGSHKVELKPMTEDIKELYIRQRHRETDWKKTSEYQASREKDVRIAPQPTYTSSINVAIKDPFKPLETDLQKKNEPIPIPIEPTSGLARNDYVNHSGKSQVAILIIDKVSHLVINTSQLITGLRLKKISATNSLFNNRFITQGYFERFFNGQTKEINDWDLSQEADYLVLGRKNKTDFHKPQLSQRGDTISAEVVIEYCIISTQTGKIVSNSTIREDFPAFSQERAELLATEAALGQLEDSLPDQIS